jgi:hypothetical protein
VSSDSASSSGWTRRAPPGRWELTSTATPHLPYFYATGSIAPRPLRHITVSGRPRLLPAQVLRLPLADRRVRRSP